jgi:hypothetical protein
MLGIPYHTNGYTPDPSHSHAREGAQQQDRLRPLQVGHPGYVNMVH